MGSTRNRNSWWNALTTGTGTFFLALSLGYLSQTFLGRLASFLISFILLIVIILIGIAFDILGIAVAAAVESPLHARAAKKVEGAKEALWLLRNADRVASFANDVVGDVCATLSGAIGASILFRLVGGSSQDIWISTAMTATISGLTVGGKALGKSFALREANEIVFWVGRILYFLERLTGRSLISLNNTKRKGRGS